MPRLPLASSGAGPSTSGTPGLHGQNQLQAIALATAQQTALMVVNAFMADPSLLNQFQGVVPGAPNAMPPASAPSKGKGKAKAQPPSRIPSPLDPPLPPPSLDTKKRGATVVVHRARRVHMPCLRHLSRAARRTGRNGRLLLLRRRRLLQSLQCTVWRLSMTRRERAAR